MVPSIPRPVMFLLALVAVAALGACSGAGGARATADGGGASSAAFAPLSDASGAEPFPLPPAGRQPAAAGPGRTAAAPPTAQPTGPAPAAPAARPDPLAPVQPRGPQIRVTWEALGVEQARFENPRFGRQPQRGALRQQEVVIVNEGHADAQAARRWKAVQEEASRLRREGRGVEAVALLRRAEAQAARGGGTAAAPIADADMERFLAALERRGFFRYARPTGSVQHLFDDQNARGRVTVERDGQSWTLISMRGQGLDPSTRPIPALYSEIKQSVMVLRNQSATLSVVGLERGAMPGAR